MKIIQIKSALVLLLPVMALLHSCSTTGDEVINPRIGNIAFIPTVTDPLTYRVSLNDEVVLENITGQTVFPYKRRSDTLRLKIVDIVNNRVIFDSLYRYRPYYGADNSLIALFQRAPGNVPFYVTPASNEPMPPPGYNKVSFTYNYPDSPDSVKAVVEDVSPDKLSTYVPTDSFYVRKNEFSRFFLSVTKDGNSTARVNLYMPDASRQRLGFIAAFEYSLNDHNMYLANQKVSATQLRTVKVY